MSSSKTRVPAAWIVVAAVSTACAASPKLPPNAPALEEIQESASAMLAREYPNWATDLAPVPGRVVGLLIPAESKWGRSLEWIGESLAAQPGAYAALGPERTRTYELYSKGVSPRLLYFAVRDRAAGLGFRAEMAVQTLDSHVRLFSAAQFTPKMDNPWGLGSEAHLAELEISGGEGNARAPRFELVATRVRLLDGQPGYPRDVTELLDGARETFNQFVKRQAPRVESILGGEASKASGPSGIPAREQVSEAIFPYWDEERKRLSILFYRRVMRITKYSIPCLFTYEGMPPEQKSMTIRYGYGVELGQRLELDANGALAAVRSFEPASVRLESNAPEVDPSAKRFPPICPGSPGANRRYHPPLPPGGLLE